MEIKTKKCIKCKQMKVLFEFYFLKNTNKYQNECICCNRIRRKEYYFKNKSSLSRTALEKYHKVLKHELKYKNYQKEYRETNKHKNKDVKKQYHKKYYQDNKKKFSQHNKIYRLENKECYKEYIKNYRKCRKNNDVTYKILLNLRCRLSCVIKNNSKSASTKELLGCTVEFLKKHLEMQFQDNMTWDNYGTGFNGRGMKEWHIDHIRPCASFYLIKEDEQQKCFHYSNLQPLWAKENLEKGSKRAN